MKKNPEVFGSIFQKTKQIDIIEDITDGEIYLDFLKKEAIGQNFSFSLFTDGISICDKSSITVWPILFIINEIPKEKRYCIDQMIIAGNLFF